MTPSALRDALAAGVGLVYGDERGDEHRIHVSDLKDCPRAVWARIRGLAALPHSPADLVKFQQGHAMEDTLAKALHAGLGTEDWAMLRDIVCWYVPLRDGGLATGMLSKTHYLAGKMVPTTLYKDLPAEVVAEFEGGGRIVVGHADAVYLRCRGYADGIDRVRAFQNGQEIVLAEMKSEAFKREQVAGVWKNAPPTLPRERYHLQGELYSVPTRAQHYALALGDRVSGGAETYPLHGPSLYPAPTTEELAAKYAAPMRGLLSLLDRDAPEPPATPPTDFGVDVVKGEDSALHVRYRACARCRYAACYRNANPMKSRADVAQEVA